ncbi:glycoside hydrolase family 15 protein [Thermoplasmatales archaeon SW_10_69_26]|nr:MAG: glycoside hydrolase family 15 protein [Thermoplasmatales archaeon SW_10_69_26]
MVVAYRPIAEYTAIGNDDRCALVDRHGSIDWCCFPTVASPSVFARILDDEEGGHFSVHPTATYESDQTYLDWTNVLQTVFQTRTGRATLTDFMPVGERGSVQRSIYRQLRCDEGRLGFEAEFKPRPDYGRAETKVKRRRNSIVAVGDGDRLHLQTCGPIHLTTRGDRAVGTGTIAEGESVWFVAQHGHFQKVTAEECHEREEATVEHWREWTEGLKPRVDQIVGDEPWQEEIVRSALVLKLLIHESSGAIYAAPTTSLPEAYGGTRNWDYRYNWIRDAKFTVQVLYNLGETKEVQDYFDWFREVSHEDPEHIQPVYGVHGEHDLPEHQLDDLAGHRHSQPVRVGNEAANQHQLDVYGAIVQGLYETLIHDGGLDGDDWRSIRSILNHVCKVWTEPDEGIWEFRKGPRHYVHSKLLCWVALDRGIRMGRRYDKDAPLGRWSKEKTEIREAILEHGYSEEANTFVQHFETDDLLDATGLLIPIYGFLPTKDERVQNTIQRVISRLLTPEGLVYRTRQEAEADGRGAFLMCSFWLVNALVLDGREEKAREIFQGILSHVDRPTLLAERIDPDTSEFLGNYPQAFSHIGLINSAIYLSSASNERNPEHDPVEDGPDLTPLFRI